jgi:hypothetical protein
MKPALAFLLLLALAVRVAAGSHPCASPPAAPEAVATAAAAAAPACHGMAETAAPSAPRMNGLPASPSAPAGPDEAPCCGEGCDKACQVLAYVPAPPVVGTAAAAAVLSEEPEESPASPFLPPLDHVPLA